MKRFCFALDLVDDPRSIAEYEAHHRAVWPEILDSIGKSGIRTMEIYRFSNRLFMIMDTDDAFDLSEKAKMDAADPIVQKWERLMWKYQQSLPTAKPGEKWLLMDRIFELRAD